jgi:hypothetical protein
MSEPSLLTSRKNPLPLNLKSRDPTNPRLHLTKTRKLMLLNPCALLLPLFLPRTRGRGVKPKIPALPSLLNPLSKNHLPKTGTPSTHTATRAQLARMFPCRYLDACSVYLSCLCSYVDSGEKEEEEEPAILGTAPTSTSNTMVLSEEDRAAAGSSPPPEQIIPTSTPPASPRAPSPKRHKTGAGEDQTLVLGSSSTSMMNDVSFLRIRFCCFLSRFHSPFPNFPSSCSSICLLFEFLLRHLLFANSL